MVELDEPADENQIENGRLNNLFFFSIIINFSFNGLAYNILLIVTSFSQTELGCFSILLLKNRSQLQNNNFFVVE